MRSEAACVYPLCVELFSIPLCGLASSSVARMYDYMPDCTSSRGTKAWAAITLGAARGAGLRGSA
eukprot:33524-Eustigmatos_ZCMA.PRE.1